MIKIQGKIPRKVMIAVSGGVDSMAALDFLRRNHNVEVFHFNHGSEYSKRAEDLVRRYVDKYNLPFQIRGITEGSKPKRMSQEEWWREERYKWIDSYADRHLPIVTCHHLDDCVETWLMSAFHGQTKLIPFQRNTNIFRPFLMTSKSSIKRYASNKRIDWIEDPSNQLTNFMRNRVRHKIIPQVLKVNPGIRTTIRKKLVETYL